LLVGVSTSDGPENRELDDLRLLQDSNTTPVTVKCSDARAGLTQFVSARTMSGTLVQRRESRKHHLDEEGNERNTLSWRQAAKGC
jgi:hypothetical protein